MITPQRLALAALLVAFLPEVFAMEPSGQLEARDVQKRGYDSYKVYERKRNAHACIMSIAFMVLFPLGAISIRLPVQSIPFMRNTYLRNKVPAMHAPIQLLALVMMIGGMALGIRIAQDLGYLGTPVHAHVVIGLLVTSIIIVVQPLMGVIQHRYYKKTGRFTVFGRVHRWVGRSALLLGIINNGLGFQLAANTDINVPASAYVKNFVIAGCLVLIWIGLIAYDTFSATPRAQKERIAMDKLQLDDERRV